MAATVTRTRTTMTSTSTLSTLTEVCVELDAVFASFFDVYAQLRTLRSQVNQQMKDVRIYLICECIYVCMCYVYV